MGIGNNIKTLADSKNISINELAKNAGIAPQTIYAIIKRDKPGQKVSPDILDKIATALNVNTYQLLGTTRYGAYQSTFFKKEFIDDSFGEDITWDYPGEKEDFEMNEEIYKRERQHCKEEYENFIQPFLNNLGYSSELILSLYDFVILINVEDRTYIIPCEKINNYFKSFPNFIKNYGTIADPQKIKHLREGQEIYQQLGKGSIIISNNSDPNGLGKVND